VNKKMNLLKEIWYLAGEMAPYLLFGFFVSGILYILIPVNKIQKHLSSNNFLGILKAALLGVPMPLCSCGVIPVTAHLRKSGAGKGPAIAFLSSTPTTGIDSIFATYSLLGITFAIIRPLAAFFNGFLAGSIINIFSKDEEKKIETSNKFYCNYCDDMNFHTHSFFFKIKKILNYSFYELIKDSGKWIIIGIIIGGLISYLLPETIIEKYLTNKLLSYLIMFIFGIPLYVCATGSIPIAASLINKGLNPGAGLIFLIAGPATNTATISFISGKFGKKVLLIYLISILITAVLFALIIDWIYLNNKIEFSMHYHHSQKNNILLKNISAIILIILIINSYIKKEKEEKIKGGGMILRIPNMSCEHCKKRIEQALKNIEGIEKININLKKKEIEIIGTASKEIILNALKEIDYPATE